MNLRELRKKRDRLRQEFDDAGGRGIELADEIDEIEREIHLRENPMKLREAREVVLYIAKLYIEENGAPKDEEIADTEEMRELLCAEALRLVGKSLS